MENSTQAPVSNEEDSALVVNAQQMIEMAVQYLAQGKFKDTDTLCNKLIAWREDHGQAWFFKALVAHAEARYQDALDCLDKASSATESVVPRLLMQGRCRAALGNLQGALESFRHALDFQPDNAEAYYWVGLTLKELGDHVESRSFLRRATLLDPNLGPAWYELGNVSMLSEKFDEAVRALKKAAELIPNAPEIPNNMALALCELEQVDEAEAAFREAIRLDDRYAEAMINLSLLLSKQGKNIEAAEMRAQAITIRPEYANISMVA